MCVRVSACARERICQREKRMSGSAGIVGVGAVTADVGFGLPLKTIDG